MVSKTNGILFAVCIAALVAGCGPLGPQADITQYFGKTEREIRRLLGEPTGVSEAPPVVRMRMTDRRRLARYSGDKKIVYRENASPLPKPLTRLEMTISRRGICTHLRGQLEGSGSPEALLETLGLGHLEREVVDMDDVKITYEIVSFGFVEVYRPSGMDTRYRSFNITADGM